jgi:hypothetical protein
LLNHNRVNLTNDFVEKFVVSKVLTERENFSIRLQQSLRKAQLSHDSPTELARDFNARFPGRPITVHAARKWLMGEAIPTQDKMQTLASWLSVPVEWLRFGGEDARNKSVSLSEGMRDEDLRVVADLQLLDAHDRKIVQEFIRILVRSNHTNVKKQEARD